MNSPRNSHFLPNKATNSSRSTDIHSADIGHSSIHPNENQPEGNASSQEPPPDTGSTFSNLPRSNPPRLNLEPRPTHVSPNATPFAHQPDINYTGSNFNRSRAGRSNQAGNGNGNPNYPPKQNDASRQVNSGYIPPKTYQAPYTSTQPNSNRHGTPIDNVVQNGSANYGREAARETPISTTLMPAAPASTAEIPTASISAEEANPAEQNSVQKRALDWLLTVNDRLNSSKAIDNPVVQRVDGWLLPLFQRTGLSNLLESVSGRAHAIVAQSSQPLKQESYWHVENSKRETPQQTPEKRTVSTATRMGFVTVVLGLIIAGWFWLDGAPTTAISSSADALLATQQNSGDGQEGTFAVINPENVDAQSLQMNAAAPLSNSPAEGDTVQPLAAIAAAMTSPKSEGEAEDTADGLSNQVRDLAINALNGNGQSGDGSGGNGDKAAANQPKTIGQIALAQRATDTPAPQPTPTITPTPTEEEIPDDVPQLRLIPIVARPSALPADTATPTPTITPTPLPIEPGGLWSTFIPGPPSEVDHFWLGRPFFPSERNQLASTNYQFGSSAFGRYRIHHGLDMSNPLGTPVLSTASGEVIHAGIDDPVLLAPFNNFYGNSVVIRLDQKLNIAGSDIDVFVLLGHLSTVSVEVGQQVSPQDVVGTVGMTGIAIGPHLHLEVRVGSNSYDKSVNPYLWMKPRDGTGVVAVRLLTSDGRTWPGGRVSLIGQGGTRFSRTIEVYLDEEPIGPDPRFGENGAIGSVPPGSYLLAGTVNGERFRKEIVVNPGETTFAEIRTQQ